MALQAWLEPAPAQAPAPATTAASGGSGAATRSFADTLEQAVTSSPAVPPTTARASYPHLSGDLDANPLLLGRLERLAAARGESWTVTSGRRTYAEQQRLWDNRATNGFPVARPGTSSHQSGNAADVTIAGRPIQDVISRAELVAAGLAPLAGDAVHIDLPAGTA